ncbi:MAG TPA: 1,4-alpha-glucan branching protein GlgB, partial [Euzebya sp.]|nr:1,4-alpha-glucan branching protein GlgB [Euzebya sp.]
DWLPIPLAALGIALPQAPTRARHNETTDEPMTDPTTPPKPADKPDKAGKAQTAGPSRAAAGPTPAVVSTAAALAAGTVHDPPQLLGFHPDGDGWVVRAWRPGAESVAYLATPEADPQPCNQPVNGLFELQVSAQPRVGAYRFRVLYPDGGTYDLVDPYSFPPSLGEVDRHLMAEGRHEQAWTVMGANRRTLEGISGIAFALWAPNARAVRIIGDFNSWHGRLHPMRSLGSSGIWELFLPDVQDGAYYKYQLITADGAEATRADPWAKWADVPPGTASRVFTSSHLPAVRDRPNTDHLTSPMSIYEVHLGSWRHHDGQPLSYRDVAPQLSDHCTEMGFTHVEFLPVAEHPFGGSWGYQVTGQFAPTSRFGSPDDFRYLVDHLHEQGIGVIVDWVPAHFPKDEWALRLFDGTALYEHSDPRLGEHPDWGTMVFNYGRTEVRNFLLASALYWIEVLGVDGLRVDAVASMLYLDYSRKAGEWIPNEHGGRENLRAVELLQEVNATVYKRNPGAVTIAEESTAWPGVSRPTHLGGLGFGFKWNMGWMHDTLSYFAREPIYRRWHHNQLTFGMMYAFSENFVLPLSHDEVVHGKGSLLGKMPGDRWQQMANLRALYAWMWGHPGKKLLFMGQEFGQDREWSEERELDWWLLDQEDHGGIKRLVADMNHAYRSLPALWRRDSDHEGFAWIDANNADDNLLFFLRRGAERDPDVAVVANLSPEPRHGVRVGLPTPGHWDEVLNTDAEIYGGSNVGNLGGVDATEHPWHGQPASAHVTCPPLAVVWLQGPA